MILTIVGLALASYLAWVGIMSAMSMPPMLITDHGIHIPHRLTYTFVVLVQYITMVGIVLMLTFL